MGSVAEQVVRRAHCSVLCVRAQRFPMHEIIEPPCSDCISMRAALQDESVRCAAHRRRRPRAHTYWKVPPSFGEGSMILRGRG
jgi:hypothetical protein